MLFSRSKLRIDIDVLCSIRGSQRYLKHYETKKGLKRETKVKQERGHIYEICKFSRSGGLLETLEMVLVSLIHGVGELEGCDMR